MTRPDHDDARPGDRPRPIVIHSVEEGSDARDPAPVAIRLRRLAAVMRGVAHAQPRVPHGEGVAWNADRPDMLTARRLSAEEEGTSLTVELRCDHDAPVRNVAVVGTIAPTPDDMRLPGTAAVVALADFVDLLADQITSDDPITPADWTTAVRAAVPTPVVVDHRDVCQWLHVAASPVHAERRVDLVFAPDQPEADPVYEHTRIDSGLPSAMHGMIDRESETPMLVNATTDLGASFGDDPVGTLRGLARIAAATDWTPPTATPDDHAQGDDA